MTSNKSAAQQLVALCKEKNIKEAVISPGSRNAPLVIAFTSDPHFKCVNVPDERAAAFIALGMARASGEAVLLMCTSGSAILNYYPAVAEAFYQKLPLVVLSADRPPEWIDQADGQTIRQHKVLEQHTVFSDSLRSEPQDEDLRRHNNYLINLALETALRENRGPVHLNVPFREPLYDVHDEETSLPAVRNFTRTVPEQSLPENELLEIQEIWDASKNILILIGMRDPDTLFNEQMTELAASGRALIFTETTSNLNVPHTFPCIDRLIDSAPVELIQSLKPDLLITAGGPVVSKKIKKVLRDFDIPEHFHIEDAQIPLDTYGALTRHIPTAPEVFFDAVDFGSDRNPHTAQLQKTEQALKTAHKQFLETAPWSDLKVFEHLTNTLTDESVHLANSSPVRYAQLFNQPEKVTFYSNRGTSGIDGCVSTAVGFALRTNKTVVAVTGDISFLYDSNALFHNHLPDNLRIIVINNGGGNIFRILPGPRTTEALEQHFESNHNFNAKGIAENFLVNYLSAQDETEFKTHLNTILQPDYQSSVILEVFTPRKENDAVLKSYFKHLAHSKSNIHEL